MANDLRTSALFVLVIEKDATFQRLIDDNFHAKYPSILVTVISTFFFSF